MKTNKQRQSEFKERMRAMGFVQVSLWIPSRLKDWYLIRSKKDCENERATK